MYDAYKLKKLCQPTRTFLCPVLRRVDHMYVDLSKAFSLEKELMDVTLIRFVHI